MRIANSAQKTQPVVKPWAGLVLTGMKQAIPRPARIYLMAVVAFPQGFLILLAVKQSAQTVPIIMSLPLLIMPPEN